MGGIHIYQMNGWWKDNRRSFHFREDLRYALHVDKIGHFHGATALTLLMGKAFRWVRYDPETSLLLGAGVSTAFQTFVEVQDGFSTWGFDRVDFASNLAGAWYPVAQQYWPPLRSVNVKFSYTPSANIHRSDPSFPGQRHLLMDDYEGQSFWLSLRVNSMLPENIERVWPDWLCLAIGYGARDVLSERPYRVWYLALDVDLSALAPREEGFLRTMAEALDLIHLPAPAVRIHPGVIWYGLYF